ncbi:alkaline phosphatase family protein [Bifidobacterium gallicum]|uniref:Nucleotide pyrophosphatase n=1 Tax=Bifidobacterium gallicum DSM 20093 = LMG 11596 TaxID=561180 RepID=A0A087AET7_9BIFI|nr:nucleotide pyrophosphatase/phosphodiesterase family protein [Bifidobacterium gallicum]KFI57287.1 nucleotide pyrophosphatase [Bifidobacterium gallicum DSM 20093 = LMG 11596]
MGIMIALPPIDQLVDFIPTVHYGDHTQVSPSSTAETRSGSAGSADSVQRSASGSPIGGALHLSSVLPAVTDALGAPVTTAVHHDPAALRQALGMPTASRALVVLVDGMGFWNLVDRVGHAPYLRGLLKDSANARPIATCAPSTTVAAMGTFGTGTCPGLTGMAGYTQLNPQTGQISQLIQFRNALKPDDLQREPTVFERLAARGVRATSVGLSKFANSPLTQASLHGSTYVKADRPAAIVQRTLESLREPGLTYLYLRDVDKVGHSLGWTGDEWGGALEHVDDMLGQISRQAPRGTLIVIVADHGMVNANPAQRIDVAQEPTLMQGVHLIGGEPRSLMLYLNDDAHPGDVAARWRERLGSHALIRTRDEALAQGLYGPVSEHVLPMLGQVSVCVNDGYTLVDSSTQTAVAMSLPSVHGSQTRMEMEIPCLIDVD